MANQMLNQALGAIAAPVEGRAAVQDTADTSTWSALATGMQATLINFAEHMKYEGFDFLAVRKMVLSKIQDADAATGLQALAVLAFSASSFGSKSGNVKGMNAKAATALRQALQFFGAQHMKNNGSNAICGTRVLASVPDMVAMLRNQSAENLSSPVASVLPKTYQFSGALAIIPKNNMAQYVQWYIDFSFLINTKKIAAKTESAETILSNVRRYLEISLGTRTVMQGLAANKKVTGPGSEEKISMEELLATMDGKGHSGKKFKLEDGILTVV